MILFPVWYDKDNREVFTNNQNILFKNKNRLKKASEMSEEELKENLCTLLQNNFAAEPDMPISNSSVYRREKIVFSRWH
ncbi:MAG: hypothetical protein E7B88_04225 [Finegoldia magna]|nr:hypothetical protein [Finegoldia magna]